MKIETKFNIGDSVWFAFAGNTVEGKVFNILIFVFNDGDIQVRYNTYYGEVNEKIAYKTKQELLNQLH